MVVSFNSDRSSCCKPLLVLLMLALLMITGAKGTSQ